jgi:hypothetical protein
MNYLSQTGRKELTPAQTRRLNHKARKRLGFVDWHATSTPVRSGFRPDRLIINELIVPMRQPSAKDFVIVTGTGV